MTRRSLSVSTFALALTGLTLCTTPVLAQQCGGDFRQFLAGVKQEAVSKGLSERAADQTLAGARLDRKVLARDRAQGSSESSSAAWWGTRSASPTGRRRGRRSG